MTKRKGKSGSKPDDSLLLLETPSVTPPRVFKEYAIPAVVFFIFAVGGSTAVWFCSHQQQTIDSLTETVNAMQLRITKFQLQLGTGNAQIANVGVLEERLQALEEAYSQAQKKADVALATSEKIKSTDLQSQFWSLQSEVNARLSEVQQQSVSTATLDAVAKNKTEEIETLKQRVNSVLAANSEVAVTISGLTDTLLVTKSRLDEEISTVEGLVSELEDQRMELKALKESFANNKNTLERHKKEAIDMSDLLEIEQAKRSQVLEEQLMALRRGLEDHQTSTHSLHAHLAAQIEIVQSQMLSESQQSGSEEEIPVEEQQVDREPTQEVSIQDEIKDVQIVTKEETEAKEVHVEDKEQLVSEEEEPAEDVQPVNAELDGNEIPEEAEVKDDVAEEEVFTEEEAVAEEVEQEKEVEEEPETQQDEGPEELQEFEEEEVQVFEEEEAIEKLTVTEDDAIPEETEGKDEDVIDEEAVTEEDAILEETERKDVDVIDEKALTEEDAIPEETEGKDGDVIDEQAVTEEIPVQEEVVDKQTENVPAEEDSASLEESEIDTSVTEAAENIAEDQVVADISQEEPLDEQQEQKDLVKIEGDFQGDEEPAKDISAELEEKELLVNES